MRHALAALAALVLSTQAVLAQGAAQAPNQFWATPLSGTGFLTLRAIGLADLSGTTATIPADTLLANPTGSAAVAQPITVLSPLVFAGTTLGLSSITNAQLANSSTTVNGVICTLGSTCTISSSAGTITVGTTTIASGTANGLLYNSAAVLGNLSTANNGTLVTDGSGVPSISATLPAAVQGNITSLGTIAGLTVTGTLTATGLITNADLVNSGTTVNGVLCTLGSACTISAVAAAGTLTGTTLAANVVNSSLTNVGLLTALGLSGAITDTQSIGATSMNGLVLANVTAAAAGSQQWSPRVHFTGQGWKTTATAASQAVDVIEELQPVQGTTNPSGKLVWSSQINGGAFNPIMSLSTGAGLTVSNGLTAAPGVQIGVPGAAFDGVTDDTAAINAAITSLYTAGGGTLYLPAGTTVINTAAGIILKSFVNVIGTEGTIIKCGSNTAAAGCVTLRSNWQTIKSGMSHIKFVAGAGASAGVVFALPSILYSDFGWLSFSGFTTGIAMNLGGVAQPANLDDAGEGGNVIFNSFHDWQLYENSGVGRFVQMGGHFSSGTTIDQVVTQNEFRSMNGTYSVHCFDIVRAADTNLFTNNLCHTATQGTAAIVLASDGAHVGVPIGVEDNVFINQIFSGQGLSGGYVAGTSGIAFWAGSWTAGNVAWSFNSDVPQASIAVDQITSPQGNCFYGTGYGIDNTMPSGMYFARFCDGPAGNSGTQAWENTGVTITPTTGSKILGTTIQGYRYLILTNTSAIATLTVQMPCAARDADSFTLTSNGPGVTALTLAACPTQSTTIYNPVTTLGTGQSATWHLIGATLSWVRVQNDGTGGGGGSGTVSSGTANQLAYYASNGTTVGGLATANSGILATNGSGVPSIVTALPAANFPALTGDITTVAGALATTYAGTVPVNKGGTGDTTLTANMPLIGNGTSAVGLGTVSGNTTEFLTFSGAATASRCLHTDANGNAIIAAADCGSGGLTWPTPGDTAAPTNPTAGDVGEDLSASATTVAIANNAATTLTSKSITAGHWLCWAAIQTNPAGATTQTDVEISVSSTNNVIGSEFARTTLPYAAAAGFGVRAHTPMVKYDATSTATLYAVAYILYQTSTLTADAQISCERIW